MVTLINNFLFFLYTFSEDTYLGTLDWSNFSILFQKYHNRSFYKIFTLGRDYKFYLNFPNGLTFNYYLLFYTVAKKLSFKFFPLSWREDDQVSNLNL